MNIGRLATASALGEPTSEHAVFNILINNYKYKINKIFLTKIEKENIIKADKG